jgi:GNAT superfamily N-acetyltransferase
MLIELSDGTEVFIRPIQPSDKAMLAAGLTRLSEATVQKRFLGPKPKLTKGELRYLTEVDGLDHHALVAVVPAWDGAIVAVARSIRLVDQPADAEAAIVVADDLQGKGLGKALARMLADHARANGIRRIHATMLSQNPPALALMRVIAERLSDGGHQQGVHEIVADLAA